MKTVVALGAALLPLFVQAACPSDKDAAAVAAAMVAREPVPLPAEALSIVNGLCGRDKVVRFLGQHYGEVIGYKAGLTNPVVQKRFNYDSPLRGALFKGMLLEDGAEVPAAFGVRPVFEADLIVEVADPAALAKAKTPLAALKALKSYAPFIELPDLMLADPSQLSGPLLAYFNVAARSGVMGQRIPIKHATQALADAFASMTVTLRDLSGHVYDSGKGSATLQNPLNSAIWLAQDLAAAGTPLKRGALLSLGSFTKLVPPKPGTTVTAQYEGLPDTPTVRVSFK